MTCDTPRAPRARTRARRRRGQRPRGDWSLGVGQRPEGDRRAAARLARWRRRGSAGRKERAAAATATARARSHSRVDDKEKEQRTGAAADRAASGLDRRASMVGRASLEGGDAGAACGCCVDWRSERAWRGAAARAGCWPRSLRCGPSTAEEDKPGRAVGIVAQRRRRAGNGGHGRDRQRRREQREVSGRRAAAQRMESEPNESGRDRAAGGGRSRRRVEAAASTRDLEEQGDDEVVSTTACSIQRASLSPSQRGVHAHATQGGSRGRSRWAFFFFGVGER